MNITRGLLLLLLAALTSSCETGFPSYSGLYAQEGDLTLDGSPQAIQDIRDAFGAHFPRTLSIHQYPFGQRKLAGNSTGPERAWEIAQRFEVGTLDAGSAGGLFLDTTADVTGEIRHAFMKPMIAADLASDTIIDNGQPIGPSCVFQYDAEAVLTFTPELDGLTRMNTGVYRRALYSSQDQESRGRDWYWSSIENMLWNPDDTQAHLTIRFTRKLAYGNFGLCQYNANAYPLQTDRVTLTAHYRRKEVYSSDDLRSNFSFAGVRTDANQKYPRERDAWPWIFDHDGTSINLARFFKPASQK